MLTDIQKYPWIGKKVDMMKINLGKKYKNKTDVFIINHALHHCPNPAKTLKKRMILWFSLPKMEGKFTAQNGNPDHSSLADRDRCYFAFPT